MVCVCQKAFMIVPVAARFIFVSSSLVSVPLKGGNKTVINMGGYGDDTVYNIAVLHRECGASGKQMY